MKPEGRKPFKQHTTKHHIKGRPDGGWWCDMIDPNKTKARREALKEMEDELNEMKPKPCKCGCKELAVFRPAAHINDSWWVMCDDCDHESEHFETEQEAIDDWNRRN